MPDEHHLDHADRRLAWRDDGAGPTLLLLQGYAGTAADWDPTFLDALRSSFRVLRPDPRGMGGSELGDRAGDEAEPYTISGLADDAVAVLDAAGVDRALVVGWSMGGFVAQTLACTAPERVAALALLSTDTGGSGVAFAAPEVWARLIDDSGTARDQAERLLPLLFPPTVAEAIGEEVVDLVAAGREAIEPDVLRAQEAAMDAWHRVPPPTPPADVPPALALSGADDEVIPPANLAQLAARWPGCLTERVDGAGHAVMAQEPERVAAAIRALGDATA